MNICLLIFANCQPFLTRGTFFRSLLHFLVLSCIKTKLCLPKRKQLKRKSQLLWVEWELTSKSGLLACQMLGMHFTRCSIFSMEDVMNKCVYNLHFYTPTFVYVSYVLICQVKDVTMSVSIIVMNVLFLLVNQHFSMF